MDNGFRAALEVAAAHFIPEQEFARRIKPAAGQSSFTWDEDSHPREDGAHDGKRPGEFAPKESGHTTPSREFVSGIPGAKNINTSLGVLTGDIKPSKDISHDAKALLLEEANTPEHFREILGSVGGEIVSEHNHRSTSGKPGTNFTVKLASDDGSPRWHLFGDNFERPRDPVRGAIGKRFTNTHVSRQPMGPVDVSEKYPSLREAPEQEVAGQPAMKPLSQIRAEIGAANDEIDASLKEIGNRLGREKAVAQRSRSKHAASRLASIEQQWEDARKDASLRRQKLNEEYTKQVESHPEFIAEKARLRQKLEEQRRKDADMNSRAEADRDAEVWNEVQSRGGYEASKSQLTDSLKSLKSRLARTGEANKWKLESNIRMVEKHLELLESLNAKFGGQSQEFARKIKPASNQSSFDWDEDSHPREEKAHDNKRPGEFAPKHAETAEPEAEADQPEQHWYGMQLRPPSLGAIPKGDYEHKPHPDFRHGQISYGRKLSDDEVHDYQLTPIRNDSEIPELTRRFAEKMGRYAQEYAKPENEEYLDEKLNQSESRMLLGHVDPEKIKAELRRQHSPAPSPADRIASEASSIADGIQAMKNRSMIYQADAKEALAIKHGKPHDAYHDLPYDEWEKIRDANDDESQPPSPEDHVRKRPQLATINAFDESGGGGSPNAFVRSIRSWASDSDEKIAARRDAITEASKDHRDHLLIADPNHMNVARQYVDTIVAPQVSGESAAKLFDREDRRFRSAADPVKKAQHALAANEIAKGIAWDADAELIARRHSWQSNPITADIAEKYPSLVEQEERPAFKPAAVPGQQMGMFGEDASGQKQLFNVVKPKKGDKPQSTQPSTLEKISDEIDARQAERRPLPGQKTIEDQYPSLKSIALPKSMADAANMSLEDFAASQGKSPDSRSVKQMHESIVKKYGVEPESTVGVQPTPTGSPSQESKEPWQMTNEEYAGPREPLRIKVKGRWVDNGAYDKRRLDSVAHKELVQQAIESGKNVPAEVLADYPDLASQYSVAEKYPSLKEPPENADTHGGLLEHLKSLGASPEQIESAKALTRGKDGVAIVHNGKLSFVNAFHPLTGNRNPAEMIAGDLKAKRGQKFAVTNMTADSEAEHRKYEQRVASDGEWDSGNLTDRQRASLERMVSEGKLTKRAGTDDEMTANGRPTVYEPASSGGGLGDITEKYPSLKESATEEESPKQYDIYETKVNHPDGPRSMFAVAMRQDGKRGTGDTLHGTREEAEQQIERAKASAAHQEEINASLKKKEENDARIAAEKNDLGGYGDDLKPNQKALAVKSLSEQRIFNGKAMPRRRYIEDAVNNGAVVKSHRVYDAAKEKRVKEEYRKLVNSAPIGNEKHPDTIRMRELKKQIEDGVMGEERRLEYPDGRYMPESVLTKHGMDYANHLISRRSSPAAAPADITEQYPSLKDDSQESSPNPTGFDAEAARDEMDRHGYAEHGEHKVKVVPHPNGGSGDKSTFAVEHYRSDGKAGAYRTMLPEEHPTIEAAQEAAISHLGDRVNGKTGSATIDPDHIHNWDSSYVKNATKGMYTDEQRADIQKAFRDHHQRGKDAKELAEQLRRKWSGGSEPPLEGGKSSFADRYQNHLDSGKNDYNALIHSLAEHLQSKGSSITKDELNRNWHNHHIGSLGKHSTDEQIKKALEASVDPNARHHSEWWMDQSPIQGPVGNSIKAQDEAAKKRRSELEEHADYLDKQADVLAAVGSDKAPALTQRAKDVRAKVAKNKAAYAAAIQQESESAAAESARVAEARRWKPDPTPARALTEKGLAKKVGPSYPGLNNMLHETGWYSDAKILMDPPEKLRSKLKELLPPEEGARYPDMKPYIEQAESRSGPPMKVIGTRTNEGGKKDPDTHTVLMADASDRHHILDAAYVQTILKHYPRATFHSTTDEDGVQSRMVAVKNNGKTVAVLMEMSQEHPESHKETQDYVDAERASGKHQFSRSLQRSLLPDESPRDRLIGAIHDSLDHDGRADYAEPIDSLIPADPRAIDGHTLETLREFSRISPTVAVALSEYHGEAHVTDERASQILSALKGE